MSIKDALGVEIEVGDIVLSAAKGDYGKFKIGRVEGVFPSGRVTMKYRAKGYIYAYERGAPDIPQKSTRPKRDESGQYVYEVVSSYRRMVFEEYEYMRKDYTVVGSKYYWVKEQAAENHIVVLRKKGLITPLNRLHELLSLDYDGEFDEESGSETPS